MPFIKGPVHYVISLVLIILTVVLSNLLAVGTTDRSVRITNIILSICALALPILAFTTFKKTFVLFEIGTLVSFGLLILIITFNIQ